MTLNTSSPTPSAGLLLSKEELTICEKISDSNIQESSQRAAALILLDRGSTQAETAEISGLSIGQVRYLVKRFKEKRLELFPAETLLQQEASAETATQEPVEATEPALVQDETVIEPATKQETMDNGPRKPPRKWKKASKKRPKPPKPAKKKKKSRRKRKKK